MTDDTYLDEFQQAFCCSMAVSANAGEDKIDPGLVDQAFAKLYGNQRFNNGGQQSWSTVWRSEVSAPFSNQADHALYVAHEQNSGRYIVAISATSKLSPYNILYEDMAVTPHAMQPVANARNNEDIGMVSAGNYAAIEILLGMTCDDQGLPSHGQSLMAFLDSVASAQTSLVFCGHSLGGGLAPLLAMALYPDGNVASNAAPAWQALLVYPSAGPATANSVFANRFKASFPATTRTNDSPAYGVWNSNQANGLDVVPNAWNSTVTSAPLSLNNITGGTSSDKMFRFQTFYAYMGSVVQAARQNAIAMSTSADTSRDYTPIDATLFEAESSDALTDMASFEQEILKRHIYYYVDHYGVLDLFPNIKPEAFHPPLLTLFRNAAPAAEAVARSAERTPEPA